MSERAELLFKWLQSAKAIRALVGKPEDADFDCKEWHGPDKTKESIAKAACGFANATGGVIVVGMSAKGTGGNSPDLVTGEKPVTDREAVKSAVLDIILKQLDPGIKGVQVHTVRDKPKSKAGFVLVYIPELDGPPQRSRADWKFYVRIASGTVPMEYFQIEDRFGGRPHPKLELIFEKRNSELNAVTRKPVRNFVLGLRNTGRGIARFPAVWFKRTQMFTVDLYGIDGNYNFGLPLRPSESSLIIFAGGIDNVIYPNQELLIARISQDGVEDAHSQPPVGVPTLSRIGRTFTFPAAKFECSISSEGISTITGERSISQEIFQTNF